MAEIALSDVLELPDDPVELARELAARHIADGLPVVPATSERVERMLEHSPIDADEELGWMPPTWGGVTPRYVAINGVLAGCSPGHLPVLIAATQAMLEPKFNLYGIQATTNPVAPLLVVHGPIARRLGINGKAGAFGPGTYANAVIGRAIRFVLVNLGGAIPGVTDRATQGRPAKYTFCVAENEEESPWLPFHIRRGLTRDDDAVTVFGIQAEHNIIDLTAENGEELLTVLAAGMAAYGTNNMTHGGEALLVISPEHARLLHGSGFDPETTTHFLYEHARVDLTKLPQKFQDLMKTRRPAWADFSRLPNTDRPEDVQLLVVGGPGIHALYMPSFGSTVAITRKVLSKNGERL